MYTVAMHRTRSKRRQIIRSTIVYSVMTTLVVVGLAIALLYVLGYRFDSDNRTLDQGGLIQVESRPSGALVFYDGNQLSGKTPRQINASAGSHTVRMMRDGYRPWQKTIAVEAGGVHWLNYALLVPEDLKPSPVREFSDIEAASPLPGEDRMLVMASDRQPKFQLVDLDSKAAVKSIALPTRIRPDGNGKYVIHDWSSNGRAVLLEYKSPVSSRWYILDVREPSRSVDASAIAGTGQALRDVKFVTDSDRQLYAMLGQTIRRIDVNQRTISAPLVEGVTNYWQSDGGILTYATKYDDKSNTRSLGYLTAGAAEPQIIQTVYTDKSTPLRMVIDEYQNRYYLALQNANTISVNRVELHRSDSGDSSNMVNVATINTESAVSRLSFSPHNRFIVAQHDATYMTYDIELDRFTSTTLRGTDKVTEPISWLDQYHTWSSRDGELRSYEFDGENVQSFGEVVSDLPVKLTRNSEWLYVFRSSDDGVVLTQIPLRVR